MAKNELKKKIMLLIERYATDLDYASVAFKDDIISCIDKLPLEPSSMPTKESDPIDVNKENFVRCIKHVFNQYASFLINREDLHRKLCHIYDDIFLIPQINEKTGSYALPNHSLGPPPLKWKRCADGMPLCPAEPYYPYVVYPHQGDLRLYNYAGVRDLYLKDKITHYCKVG